MFATSTLTGKGIKELLYYVSRTLSEIEDKPITFEQEFFPEDAIANSDLPYTIETEEDRDGETVYVVEGPKIERMLSYTNLDSEKGFRYFTQFLRRAGIISQLKEAGIREGQTVRLYGHVFEFYDDEALFDESDE